jgi:phage terminase large subunit-like protein
MARNAKLLALKNEARKAGWLKYVRSEADERAMLNGCRFNIARGMHCVDFFPRFLRHSKGEWANRPFELLDWQRDDLVLPLFGWERQNDTGRWVRRFTKTYVEVPKKNGKSTLASGIGLYMLVADGEGGAEVYSAANDRKQAGIVHGEAINMVKSSPELSKVLRINNATYQISYDASQSYYRALTAEAGTNEGWNGHCCICDELHKWYGRKLWDALRYMFRARSQGLLFVITTAGDDMQSVCREQHDYAQGVLKGKIFDDRFFPLIYAAGPKDDWLSEKSWRKANPSYGITINAEEFAADAKEAAKSPASTAGFKRYSLNIWTTGDSPWLNLDDWLAGQQDYTEDDLAGMKCWAGLDLSKTRDTTSLVLVFPWEDGSVRILPYFWLPEETAKSQDHLVSYMEWSRENLIRLTPGDVCDYTFVKRDIRDLFAKFDVQQLAYDPKFAEELTQELEQGKVLDGVTIEHGTGVSRLAYGQTISNFASPTAEWERLVISHKLHHNNHPVMNWQIGNALVYTDANNNKRPVKPKPNDYRKIDGVVAGIQGLFGAITNGGGPVESVYDRPGSDDGVIFV